MLMKMMTITYFLGCYCLVNAVPLAECLRYAQLGDINIGGMFSFFVNSKLPCQKGLAPRGVFMAESMRFAIEEINNRTDLLPNINLGFDIFDDGWSEDLALKNTLDLVNDRDTTNQVCFNQSVEESTTSVVGIIGTSRSATTIPSTRLAALYDIPIISYYASSVELTDKSQFPYFLRTVPPDGLQVGAIVDILELYNWNYIGVIHSIDSYGIHGARQLQTLAEVHAICIAFTSPVSDSATDKELQEVIDKFDDFPMAKTVVMFASGKVASKVLKQIKQKGFTREINWIGSDDWGYDLKEIGVEHLTTGAIFTRFYSIPIPEYEKYIRQLRFNDPFPSPWYKEYWIDKAQLHNCTDMDLCTNLFLEDDFSAIYITLPVIDAVYVIAHGLHSLLTTKCNNNHTCKVLSLPVEGDELLTHLRNVNFEARSGSFKFDANADPSGKYILRNLQMVGGEYQFIDVGLWNSANSSNRLTLDQNKIRFLNGTNLIPQSTCRSECKHGSIVIPLERKCCWGCQKCLPNAIVVTRTECVECPDKYWPDSNFTSCNPINPTNLEWSDPLVIVITIISIIGVILCFITVAGMGWYGDQPIIKACSRELSAINILGIFLSCICTFILVLPPDASTCMTVDATISMSFTLTYAPTLLKVNRIYRIFRAGRKSVKRPKMVGPKEQLIIVFIVILFQVIIVALGLGLGSAVPIILLPDKTKPYVETYCRFGYGFIISCVYNALLILSCCYYAFRSRKVPDNYNESKFIAISVYSTSVVFLSIVPVYSTSNSAIYKVAVVSLALLVNAYLNLLCVYSIKLYAVRYMDPDEIRVGTLTFQATGPKPSNINKIAPAVPKGIADRPTTSDSETPHCSEKGTSGDID